LGHPGARIHWTASHNTKTNGIDSGSTPLATPPKPKTPSHDWLRGVTICLRHNSGNTMHDHYKRATNVYIDFAGANAEDLECGSPEIGRVINVFND
jgi:hypothetical protein